MLSVALLLSRFNPVSGGYLTVIFGVMTTYLMFMLGKEMFSQRAGLIAALLYASSPLIVTFDRMPFDPSPIPFFTVLYLFSLVKWVKGNVNYFPVVLLLLAILYNLELATFTLVFPFALIFAYGCFKKRDWIKGLFTKKIVFFSFALTILVMLPVIVYYFSNGFKQTAVFLGWTLYRPFSFLFHHQSGNLFVNLKTILAFCLLNMQTLIFQESFIISLLLFAAGICVLSSQVLKNKKINEPKTILLFLLVVGLLGIIVNQSPSEAYLPIVLPFIIFTVAILFEYLLNLRFLRYVSILVLSVVILSNVYTILNNDSSTGFKDRLNAANQIIKLADDQAYNLEGRGPSSQFASFTMNYEYLLWWKGHAASNQNVQNKIVVWESPKGIIIYKQ